MESPYSSQQKALIQQLKLSLASGQGKEKLSYVEMQQNYESERALCLTAVAFLPARFSQILLTQVVQPLQALQPGHFYTDESTFHLTIKNIRVVNDSPLFDQTDIAKANNLFSEIIPEFPKLRFNFEELILFPTSVSAIGYCDEKFSDLVQNLDQGLKQIGVPDNKKYFSDSIFFANVTLCRFTQQPNSLFRNKLKELERMAISCVEIDRIGLITCNAVCHPHSRIVIATYSLKG
jgi:hypothetical protein